MAPLLYSDILKAVPADETKSSYVTYRSYLNKLGAIGYKDGLDILCYIEDLTDTCQRLKHAGVEAKECTNIFKALKFFATKANKYLDYKIDLYHLEDYKSEIIDYIYGTVSNPQPKNIQEEVLTDIEDEPVLPDKRLVNLCNDLKKKQAAMEERMHMMEKILLEIAKSNPTPSVTELLYKVAMQSFL